MSFPWCDNFAGCITINLKYKYSEAKQKYGVDDNETVAAIHALLNSEGGLVRLLFTGTVKATSIGKVPKPKRVIKAEVKKNFIRKIEQVLVETAGILVTSFNVNIKEDSGPNIDEIIVEVKSANVMIMNNTHLYLPTEEQVNVVSSTRLETIYEILNRQNVENGVSLGSHCKIFHKDRYCDFQESKVTEFKLPKADSAKRTKLADRITGKSNRFSDYVSAFANYEGGHIYCGIRDDGIVEGEFISSDKEMINITQKVKNAIEKMFWPEQIGLPKPKRGVHWDIFFEPVVDEDSRPIPSIFVIVVYIAPCLGGVFTEVPECYEMVGGKVKKMSDVTWKRRILFHSDKIPSTLQRITKNLTGIQVICTTVNELLTQHLNNGKPIKTLVEKMVKKLTEVRFPGLIEIQLVILSKQVTVCCRSCCFVKAQELLKRYDDLLKKLRKTTKSENFDATRAYLEVALHRARSDVKAQRKALDYALKKAKEIAPGLITAEIYLLAATVNMSLVPPKNEDQVARDKKNSPDVLSIRALEDLQHVNDSPILRADMQQQVHITLASFYLGCNTSDKVLTKKDVDRKSLEKAKSNLTAVNKSIYEGNPMNRYREIQFNLVQSVLFYRYSQIQPEIESREMSLLQEAYNFSKKAELLAVMCRFEEMIEWARACKALYTGGLACADLKKAGRRRPITGLKICCYLGRSRQSAT